MNRIIHHAEECTCLFCVPCKMASKVSPAGLVDEFGFPLPAGEMGKEISPTDLELIRRFLGQIKDSTLSRGTHRVLSDLLERIV